MYKELLCPFWSFTKIGCQAKIFKIISLASFYLKQVNVEFLFKEITA
jgi:hypothetical protein